MMSQPAPEKPFDAPAEARRLIRSSRYASLATLDAKSGAPYASLIATATDSDGSPLILISTLALHTRNIAVDPLVSVLFASVGGGDPMVHPRVSLSARAEKSAEGHVRRRFLARHQEAAFYAGFQDFAFYRLVPLGAHLVAGFGRIVDLGADQLLTDLSGATSLLEIEDEAVQHVNADHPETVSLYATGLLGLEPGDWRMTGLDPAGCDLAYGDRTARLDFPDRVTSAADLRKMFQRLAEAARSEGSTIA
jgi:putative heme iron utilization protein